MSVLQDIEHGNPFQNEGLMDLMIALHMPKIKGMTIMNEKRVALSLLILRITARAMVAPLLEIPGIIATA